MVGKFLQYIQSEKNYSPHTVLSYQNDLKQFSSYCVEMCALDDITNATTANVRQWLVSLMEAGEASTSARRKISCLKSFFRFLQREGCIKKNPAQFVILPKMPKPLPKFFRESEMNQVLDIGLQDVSSQGVDINKNSFEFCRDKLIIDFFYQTGVRVSELVGVKNASINFSAKNLKVLGKRNKERIIPVGLNLLDAIGKYVKIRDKQVPVDSGYLFVRSNGLPMYPRGVYNIVHKYMSFVSSASKRSPHVLRHTFASTLLNNGADINAVKSLLGHSSLAATEIYTHTSFRQLQIIYKHAHPRAQNLGGQNYGH